MEGGRGGNRDSYIVSTYVVQGVVPIFMLYSSSVFLVSNSLDFQGRLHCVKVMIRKKKVPRCTWILTFHTHASLELDFR